MACCCCCARCARNTLCLELPSCRAVFDAQVKRFAAGLRGLPDLKMDTGLCCGGGWGCLTATSAAGLGSSACDECVEVTLCSEAGAAAGSALLVTTSMERVADRWHNWEAAVGVDCKAAEEIVAEWSVIRSSSNTGPEVDDKSAFGLSKVALNVEAVVNGMASARGELAGNPWALATATEDLQYKHYDRLDNFVIME